MVLDQSISGMHQLHPHDYRQETADHPCNDGKEQIKRADVLVIGRAKPAEEEARRMAMAMNVMAVQVGDIDTALVSHFSLLDLSFRTASGESHRSPTNQRRGASHLRLRLGVQTSCLQCTTNG